MKKYKLTTQGMQTHKGFQWELGKQYEIDDTKFSGKDLCTASVFHFYDSPELAALLNCIHANIDTPRLFECECGQIAHDGLKGGSKKMTLKKELHLPKVTGVNRVAFGILCALKSCHDPVFVEWANKWLSGADRTAASAASLAKVNKAAKWTAAWATERAATRAIEWAAAWAAEWTAAWAIERATAWAIERAEWAAQKTRINFVSIAKKAMEIK